MSRWNTLDNAEVCVLNFFLSLSRLDIFSVSAEFCMYASLTFLATSLLSDDNHIN